MPESTPHSPDNNSNPLETQVPHSGKHGERPVFDFRNPDGSPMTIEQAFAAGKIHVAPDTIGDYSEPTKSMRTEAFNPMTETAPPKNKRGRKGVAAVAASAVAAAVIGGIGAVKMFGGDDADATPGKPRATATAPATPGETPQSNQTPEAAPSPEAIILDGNVTVLEEISLESQLGRDRLAAEASSPIAPQELTPLVNNELSEELSYTSDTIGRMINMPLPIGDDEERVKDTYNQYVVAPSQLFGQEHSWANPAFTKKELGSMQFATRADVEQAIAKGDATELVSKWHAPYLTPYNEKAFNVMVEEVKAGEIGRQPASIDILSDFAALGALPNQDNSQEENQKIKFLEETSDLIKIHEEKPDMTLEGLKYDSTPVYEVIKADILNSKMNEFSGDFDQEGVAWTTVPVRVELQEIGVGDGFKPDVAIFEYLILPAPVKNAEQTDAHQAILIHGKWLEQ